jgi:hypothetical protein
VLRVCSNCAAPNKKSDCYWGGKPLDGVKKGRRAGQKLIFLSEMFCLDSAIPTPPVYDVYKSFKRSPSESSKSQSDRRDKHASELISLIKSRRFRCIFGL